ncbi:gamma-glutamyl-gamma-aminobutyrate hydrolase family protein [Bacteroides sp. 519]|uniref:gamma-glutamyl-gamma-aminobutyrate hydrolase family protein n=1 Tax=Bacteroides sp. 519 TaxID=2302937 RepID=UPI0013D7DECA|nr:gamma-glutamyl-gamma-aminobutyrate hydrolase family protein [Bacteroides sp. 519]NDV58653.1 gamma-glutamyl-gamma-aminobutyrate hydrolase family protein [Bacteroides sp. 519]
MKKIIPTVLFLLLPLWGFAQKPIIGISCSYPNSANSSVRNTYVHAVINAGGIPVLVPVIDNVELLEEILTQLDALILTGGEDIHPSYYNEEPIPELGNVNNVRDVYDIALIKLAAKRNLPLLGICRGEQLINVAFGGSLYQDIPAQHADTTVNHNQAEPSKIPTHYVTILPGSVIASITGEEELVTNTHHHQAVKQIAPGFRVSAWACDSIPEAIETVDGRPIWGVQFHPEGPAMEGDSIMSRFFNFIVEQASIYRFKETLNSQLSTLN